VAYLERVTELLHRRRLADPVGGLWEAADLQWWSTRDPEPAAEFWSDGTGPVAAAVLTRWGPDRRTGVGLVEPMRVEDAHAGRGLAGALLRAGLDRLADHGCRRLKVSHDTDNPAAERLYHGAGFVPGPRTQVLRRPTGS
jgi:GNAT superfamily N-acetyltransferase